MRNDDDAKWTRAEIFRAFLGDVRGRVERDLETFFEKQTRSGREAGALEFTRTLVASRALALRGGKRVRPAFVAIGYRIAREASGADGSELSPIAPAFVAFELLQTYLLAHDDWMDGDAERRGGPSLHAALAAEIGDGRDGEVLSVLAGDWLHAASYAALSACDVPAAARGCAVEQFAAVGRSVVRGQVEDVRRAPRTRQAVEALHRAKTGSYTIEGPLFVGLALGGIDPMSRNDEALACAVWSYADPLGLAFQLKDDLLGAFGDPAATGKPAGADLRIGKPSAVTIALWERATGEVRDILGRVLGGGAPLTDAELARVHDEAERRGVRAELAHRLDELLRACHSAVGSWSFSARSSLLLSEAARAMVERNR